MSNRRVWKAEGDIIELAAENVGHMNIDADMTTDIQQLCEFPEVSKRKQTNSKAQFRLRLRLRYILDLLHMRSSAFSSVCSDFCCHILAESQICRHNLRVSVQKSLVF